MRLVYIFLLLTFVFITNLHAQTCTGSLGAPVIDETFGHGYTYSDMGLPLDTSITKLQYFTGSCGGEDGQYTLLSSLGSSCKGGTWKALSQDHTGDKFGYMMIINATDAPSVFFTYRVKGDLLCPNTTYQFAAWILNILRDLPITKGYSEPNITFSIEKPDGTVLKSFNTGNIKADDLSQPSWKQYGTFFISPGDGSDVIVKMTNNSSGGNGNDLALDDITFSPCGPLIQVGFDTLGNTADKNACANDNLSYTLVAQQTGYPDPSYQWQVNKNDGNGWADIPNATTTSLNVNVPDAAAGTYQYRIGVLSGPKAGSESCRIFSDPLNINVYTLPEMTVPPNTSACIGHTIQLSSSGGDDYLWTGPNNFTSTDNSPVVTYNADPSYEGEYTVRITRNNCPAFETTTVKVYKTATIEPLKDVSICAGDSIPIITETTNATHFQWLPADGLNRADIANPLASPAVTTTYIVTVSNDGCTDITPTASITVTVFKNPTASAGASKTMFEGQKVRLDGKASGDNIHYFWTPPDFLDNPTSLTPTTSATGDITYTLHVQSDVGCPESTSSVFVRVYKKLTIYNSFSPNGDGVNDYWNIKNIEYYPKATVSVYTRDGQRIFQSTGYSKPWDGTYNKNKVPPGTYYYVINFNENPVPDQSGWILVVR